MEQHERQRLEEVEATMNTIGWRYIQEELSTQIDNIKEALLYVEGERELGRMQGRAEQAAVIINLGAEVSNLLGAEGDDVATV